MSPMILAVPDAAQRICVDGYQRADSEVLARPGHASHIVQFYDGEGALGDAVAGFLAAGLAAGEPLVVIATEVHNALFMRRLRENGFVVEGARRSGQLTILDAHETLSQFMVDGMPDWDLFQKVVGEVLATSAASARGATVRAYGEMVDILWKDGNQKAAIRLEEMWNEIAATHSFALLCAYVMGSFYKQLDGGPFHSVCRTHSHVIPPESYAHLQAEVEHRREVEKALRESLADLRRSDEELKRTVGERERLIEDLSRTVRFSEMFVGILGHDLRNPLSAISTASTHLLRRVGDEKLAKTVGRIVSSSERMARMIDQLLDFTRLRLGRGLPLTPQRTDLEEVCRLALDELDDALAGRTVEFQIHGDTVGHWDVDRLGQLTSNLLANALHHGTPGDPVVIAVDGRAADTVRVEVANRGVVRPEILPVIFEPFRSSSDRKEARSSGLGLGLFISRQIVLAHGGSIDVKSSEEDGTRFTVVVPRRAASWSNELGAGGGSSLGENVETASDPRSR
jgi:signal transduction histidine kinase